MIEKVVADLKKMFALKNDTREGDVLLVVSDRIFFAVVTSIERDQAKRDEWWHVGLQLLLLPPRNTTWTLRTPQFTGQEIFTMGGEPHFIAAIDFWAGGGKAPTGSEKPAKRKKPALRVIK